MWLDIFHGTVGAAGTEIEFSQQVLQAVFSFNAITDNILLAI